MDIEHYGECQHVSGRECINRYYEINDIKKGKKYALCVCNEFIRIKMNEINVLGHGIRLIGGSITYDKYRDYNSLISHIIGDHTGLKINRWRNITSKVTINPLIDICICERPYTFTSIPFTDALSLFIDYDSGNYSFIYHELLCKIEQKYGLMIKHMSKYIKYKTVIKKAIRLQKKIKDTRYDYKIGIDIIHQILDLITKYNIK